MIEAFDQGMTRGEYVFYTLDILPQDDLSDVRDVWMGGDGRDVQARAAFEAVFHVSRRCHLHIQFSRGHSYPGL